MILPPDRKLVLPPGINDVITRNCLARFVQGSFEVINPNQPLVWDPYLDLICSRLQAVAEGKIPQLIITLPPRHLKTICVSVALPAFYLGHNPSAEVMCVSYNQSLAKEFAEGTRAVMMSPFYKRTFATRLAGGRQPAGAMRTSARGTRRATSMEGTATGVGADLLIFDDPQKANGILSNKVRGDINELYRSTFMSRANDPAHSRTIIVMQRLHEDDFAGFVSGLGTPWEILNLPAIAEEDETFPYTSFLGAHVFRRPKGAALNPGRVDLNVLAQRREMAGEAVWATQYQQRPAPAGGGVVNIGWLKRYSEVDRPELFDKVIQSWDVASMISPANDFSVCTTWGVKEKRIFLLDVFRKRLIFPDLKRAVMEQAAIHQPTTVVIENVGTGISLIQDLKRDGFPNIRAYVPEGDKQTRMEGQTGPMAAGYVFVPHEAHWLDEYLHELAVFPRGRHDDQVDSTSQALHAMRNLGIKGEAYLEIALIGLKERGLLQPEEPEPTAWAIGSVEWAAQNPELAAARAALDVQAAAMLAA